MKNPDGSDSVLFVDSDGMSKDNAMMQKIITDTMHLQGVALNKLHEPSLLSIKTIEKEKTKSSKQNSPQHSCHNTTAYNQSMQDEQRKRHESGGDPESRHSQNSAFCPNMQELSTSVREFMNYTNN